MSAVQNAALRACYLRISSVNQQLSSDDKEDRLKAETLPFDFQGVTTIWWRDNPRISKPCRHLVRHFHLSEGNTNTIVQDLGETSSVQCVQTGHSSPVEMGSEADATQDEPGWGPPPTAPSQQKKLEDHVLFQPSLPKTAYENYYCKVQRSSSTASHHLKVLWCQSSDFQLQSEKHHW